MSPVIVVKHVYILVLYFFLVILKIKFEQLKGYTEPVADQMQEDDCKLNRALTAALTTALTTAIQNKDPTQNPDTQ